MGKSKRSATTSVATTSAEVSSIVSVKPSEEEKAISISVNAELDLTNDYLDMVNAPDANGLAHSGYLVLRKGENIIVLYVGSEAASDEDWCYAQVLRSLPPSRGRNAPSTSPVGTRGWLPVAAIEQPKPASKKTSQKQQNSNSAPVSPSGAVEAFAGALSGAAAADAADGSHAAKVAEAVAAQRAAAAKAVAKMAGKSGNQTNGKKDAGNGSCPICAEVFDARRRGVLRACCKTLMCGTCDQKSVSSGRCFFCREENGEFPSLSTMAKPGR